MKKIKTVISGVCAVALICGFAGCSYGDQSEEKSDPAVEFETVDSVSYKEKWNTIASDFEQVSMNPGSDITKMNYAYYSKTAGEAKMKVAKSEAALASAQAVEGTCEEYKTMTVNGESVTFYANKVTVTGLSENTKYFYQNLCDGTWSKAKSFKTGSSGDFSFIYVGDPQIGSSGNNVPAGFKSNETTYLAARYDSFNWNNVLAGAFNNHPEVDFILSAGDQIDATSNGNQQEIEYAGFLSAEVLSSLPIATTIGNHDSRFANYKNHFNTPNAYTEEEGASPAGNDYYYTYGNVLFIMLNTNNYNVASHEALIKKAVEENAGKKWRIVTFHQDIYGSGKDHSASDGMILRTQLTTLLDKYDIDVVLQGHDHTYSRSHLLTSDGNEHPAFSASNAANFQEENLCYIITENTSSAKTVTDPKGILYMEANSSTGSKYYNLIPTQQDYIAARSQTFTPTYSVINIKGGTFTINTYDSETGKKIDEEFKIVKTK